MRRLDRWAAVGAGVASAALIGFIVLPVLAIFLRVPLGRLVARVHSPAALQALGLSLKTSLIALALILLIGTPAAYVLGTRRFPGRLFVLTVLELPLVLPPAVAGIGLFAAFGRSGLLGRTLDAAGVQISFTQIAVVMALAFVSMPFYVRQAVASFESVDPVLLGASRTLGAGAAATLFRVAIPTAAPGLSAGAALAWARSLGEFGATIVFAGSLPGKTRTLPLAAYADFATGDLAGALAIAALLVAVSGGLLIGIRLLLRTWTREKGASTWPRSSASISATV